MSVFPLNIFKSCQVSMGFPGGSDDEESACNVRGSGWILRSGIFPGEGNGYQLWYSCLESPMDEAAWWVTVHRVVKLDMTERLNKSLVSFLPKESFLLSQVCAPACQWGMEEETG